VDLSTRPVQLLDGQTQIYQPILCGFGSAKEKTLVALMPFPVLSNCRKCEPVGQ